MIVSVFGNKAAQATPKWMVYFMENPIKMDDLGYHHFRKPPYVENPPEIYIIFHRTMKMFHISSV